MSSPLERIRDGLTQKRTRKTLDLPVPGLADIGVYVSYARLVGIDQVRGYRKRRKDDMLRANLDFLVDSCVGVWAEIDGKQYGFSPDTPTDRELWPVFDDAVRQMLPDGAGENAVDIARALFAAGYAPEERAAAEADILHHADELMQFCGYKDPSGN